MIKSHKSRKQPLRRKNRTQTIFATKSLLLSGGFYFLTKIKMANIVTMNIEQIMQILPHRFPFLLVDRVVECKPGESIRAYKNVTADEPFFQGHFPGVPIMPGVLILEALAQTGGLLAASSIEGSLSDKLFLFTGLDGVKFRKQVIPGDRLDLECANLRMKLRLCKLDAHAYVDGKLACEAVITAALGEKQA